MLCDSFSIRLEGEKSKHETNTIPPHVLLISSPNRESGHVPIFKRGWILLGEMPSWGENIQYILMVIAIDRREGEKMRNGTTKGESNPLYKINTIMTRGKDVLNLSFCPEPCIYIALYLWMNCWATC